MLILLLSIGWLTHQRVESPHIEVNMQRGILLLLVWGILGGFGFFALTQASHLANPLVIGYIWEIMIGVFIGLWIIGRYLIGNVPHKIPTPKTILRIIICSLPVTLASSAIVLAISLGYSSGIAFAINSATAVLVTVILGSLLYHEKITKSQMLPIFFIVASAIGLRLLG